MDNQTAPQEQTPTQPKKSKALTIALSVIVVVIILLAGVSVWFYKTPMNGFKNKLANVLPFPAALVNGHPISIKSYNQRMASAQTIAGNLGQQDASSVKSQVLDEMIEEKKTEIVADQHGVSVSGQELNSQLAAIKNQANQQSPNGFGAMLGQYSLTESQFANDVLKPELLFTDLNLWFNSQRSLNSKEYQLADSIKSQLASATSSSSTFASLVNQYSQDDTSKQTQGDLGFVEINSLLPEFRAALDGSKPGDIKIVPSRYGIHIIQVTATDTASGTPRAEVKQIFLNGEDFTSWYQNETKNIKIKKLI